MRKVTAVVAGEELVLHPLKAIFWKSRSTLLLADTHFGKAAHFRKMGIAVPPAVAETNRNNLRHLLDVLPIKEVIFLGDLFHSDYNAEWEELGKLFAAYPEIGFRLIAGNHDILHPGNYDRIGLPVHGRPMKLGPFLLSHEPLEEQPEGLYNLSGHIHPGVRLLGKGRQSLRVPCFYFGPWQGILPAFGAFTGKFTIKPSKGDQVFGVVENTVMEFSC